MNRDTMSKIVGGVILCVSIVAYVVLALWDGNDSIQGLIVFVTPVVTYMLMRDQINAIGATTEQIKSQTNGLLHQHVETVADEAIARYATKEENNNG